MPLFLADFWLWLYWTPGRELKLRVVKTFGPRRHIIWYIAADGNSRPIKLRRRFVIREGEEIDLSEYEAELKAMPRPRRAEGVVRPPTCIGLDATGWRLSASASGPGLRPEYAIDRQPGTRWSTGSTMRGGEWIAVDLGRSQAIAEIWLWLADHRQDWPHGLRVEISKDGHKWTPIAVISADECHKLLRGSWWRLRLPNPVETRWLKLTQLGRDPGHWWSVHEIYLRPPVP